MCGFLVHIGEGDNSLIKLRGQDQTNTLDFQGIRFTHNLLSITGEVLPQPFTDDGIVAVYNGEIYNLPFNKSDGENIIPMYKKHGPKFAQELDGEFAIALYDFNKGHAVFITDTFGTKPMWVKGIECASLKSGVGGERLGPNRIVIKDFQGNIKQEYKTHKFEWDNQHKDTYDDWISAFKEAIKKRAKDGCFIGLSSGYDSGSIAYELMNKEVEFKAYHVPGQEHELVLKRRAKKLKERYKEVPPVEYKGENINYTIKYDGKVRDTTLRDDKASKGLAGICKRANAEKRRVYISGQGADEILADYGLWRSQSELEGIFPKNLEEWHNFRHGCQESYLAKEEYVTGYYNIEGRYPFLDKQVVQEFLWLTPELKNKEYKAPLYEYMTRNNVPFEYNVKRGFNPDA